MEKTIEVFKARQAKVVHVLEKLGHFLQQGKEAGVNIDPKLEVKIKNGNRKYRAR